jgi:hypothetical protein
MNLNLKVLLTALVLAAGTGTVAIAHPGHKHEKAKPEIGEQAAKDRAKQEVDRLVEKKKLDESWKASSVKGLEKKPLKKGWEWLATFENPSSAKNKTLYVFLKPSGEFVAANFTGK